ncbi:hypothetical protein [Allorhizocola rhizosphaerae]|uniref:hypothetical protein n=1 Tax=Allorhizocola rhizosphaerae TaxID=1872709 RepID=UPI0013C2C6C8|nr:hypothetical protein [Allorhizocola rhizosphaerae]
MKLTLTYEGVLPSRRNGISTAKAALRSAFHPQLVEQVRNRVNPKNLPRITSTVEGQEFVSIANKYLRTAVELDVLLLTRRGVRASGDMDNRLKTLIDGLTRPQNKEQMRAFQPPHGGGPMYCLLDDDDRVVRLGIDSRRWYDPRANDGDALVVITATMVLGEDASMNNQTPTANLFVVL